METRLWCRSIRPDTPFTMTSVWPSMARLKSWAVPKGSLLLTPPTSGSLNRPKTIHSITAASKAKFPKGATELEP